MKTRHLLPITLSSLMAGCFYYSQGELNQVFVNGLPVQTTAPTTLGNAASPSAAPTSTPNIPHVASPTPAPTGSLSAFTGMPTHLAYPVAMGAAVELKDHIYIVGGTSDWSTPIDTIQSATYTGGILGPFATLPLKLAQARCGAASQVIGNYLYIFGGSKTTREGFPLDTCNRFPINDDGTLGAGIELSNVHMKSGRVAFSVLYTGPYIYAIGGSTSPGQYTDSIERAPVNPDGTIGDFDNVPGVRLTEGKFTQALTWIGNKVYILGGETTMSSVSTVEVATVGDDGQLGTFAAYPNILSARRNRISLITLGNRLYLFGGFDGMGGFYTSVDTATVDGNSALGTFGISGTTTLTTGVESGTSLLTPDAAFYFGGHNFANGVTDVIQRATISP